MTCSMDKWRWWQIAGHGNRGFDSRPSHLGCPGQTSRFNHNEIASGQRSAVSEGQRSAKISKKIKKTLDNGDKYGIMEV